MDCSPPGSSIHEISQARILERVIISFFRGSSWPREPTRISCNSRWILSHWTTSETHRHFGFFPNNSLHVLFFLIFLCLHFCPSSHPSTKLKCLFFCRKSPLFFLYFWVTFIRGNPILVPSSYFPHMISFTVQNNPRRRILLLFPYHRKGQRR